MSRQEAEELVKEAIALAMSRDGSSGGVIRLVTVNKDGAERKMIQGPEVPTFWDELAPSAAAMVIA
jgi:20S proteasome subunit beta 1